MTAMGELARRDPGTPARQGAGRQVAHPEGTHDANRAEIAPPSRHRPLTGESREQFLSALAEGFSITHAARLAGSDRRRMYEARAADPQFAEEWADAWEQGSDRLEDALRQQALGYDET